MALAQRGCAEALVRLHIALIADPDMAEIEQPHDRRYRGLLVEAAAVQILLHPRAQFGQRPAKRRAKLVFRRFLRLAEFGVIAILLAALLVPADRLDMAIRLGAEPGIAIGRRQADA